MSAAADRPTVHLIPHTHWDREWYLPLVVFQSRLVPVVDDALDLLERDPTQRMTLDGQTVLVEDYLALRPGAEDRIRPPVSRGALEIGPWYVLADELIPSGESLVRNLLEGAADAARLGARSEVLYSPDAFGHPAVLPALAREFGLASGALWRGLGNPAGADRDLYRWVAPDGAALLVYHLPPAGYEVGIGLSHDPSRWSRLRDALGARSTTGQVALFVGADHHAIPDLSALRDGHPDARISTLGDFMRAVANAPAVEVQGELRHTGHTWVLQGVHGTRSRMKRSHGVAELALSRLAEPLAALAAFGGGRDQRPALRRAWRSLLQSQFHDTLGGCSADVVAETQERRLDDVHRLAHAIGRVGFDAIAGHDPDVARERPGDGAPVLALWNPVTRPREGIVIAELAFFRGDVLVGPPTGAAPRTGTGAAPFALGTGSTTMPVQVLTVRRGMERVDARRHAPDQDEVDRVWVAFESPAVPALGTGMLWVEPAAAPPKNCGLTVSSAGLANRFVALRVSSTGTLEFADLPSGERYPALAELEDETEVGDTYTHSRGPGRTIRGGRPVSRTVLAGGPLVGALETRWELAAAAGGALEVRQVVALHADSPLVRVRLEIINAASDHRLRMRFPIGAGHEAIAGAAFGFERRAAVDPDRRPGLIERPVLTAPAHRYVAAGEGDRGLALFAPAFFEYEWTEGRDLLLTLVRSVGELSRDALPERPGHAGWPEPVPLAQEHGSHRIDFAIAPVNGSMEKGVEVLERLWEDAFLPVQSRCYRNFAGDMTSWGGLVLEGDGLVASAIKPGADGGLVLRCWNARTTPLAGRWVSGQPLARAALLRADETELGELAIANARSVAFSAGPRAIVTIAVRRKP